MHRKYPRSWGPVHHSKCGDSRVLRKFAKPLCLIAPEFEPDRLAGVPSPISGGGGTVGSEAGQFQNPQLAVYLLIRI